MEFLVEINILADKVSSLYGNIMPHTSVLVADVVTKVNSSTDPGKGDTTQLNITNFSISIEEGNTLCFTFCRIFMNWDCGSSHVLHMSETSPVRHHKTGLLT